MDGQTDKVYVNNHIHTTYSFSPYSPAEAVKAAKAAGLATAGIVDHDSISGARAFIEAGRTENMPTTIGIECRVSMVGTPFFDKRLNHTDQKGIAYVAMHGIPHQYIDDLQAFMVPYQEKRNVRNRAMVDHINALFDTPILDFERDVVPLSMNHDGGTITERHLLYALSLKLMERFRDGATLIAYLKEAFDIGVSDTVRGHLSDRDNPHYAYDLLGLLKGHFMEKVYIDATDECMPVAIFIEKAKAIGAIPAYAYLGDIHNSVTGDKKDDAFEDAYIEDLMAYLKAVGFSAVTYMPTRNSSLQLARLRGLCQIHEFFEISGEDINSSRQVFTCEKLTQPEFAHLVQATWALIGHEMMATKDKDLGLFGAISMMDRPSLKERILYFEQIGRKGLKPE